MLDLDGSQKKTEPDEESFELCVEFESLHLSKRKFYLTLVINRQLHFQIRNTNFIFISVILENWDFLTMLQKYNSYLTESSSLKIISKGSVEFVRADFPFKRNNC